MSSGSRRLVAYSLLICLLALAVLSGVDRHGKASRKGGAAREVGKQPMQPNLVATPEDAYRYWKEKGFHGRTVLYLAQGWERFDPNEFNEEDPRRSYPLKVTRSADQIEARFLDRRTFLYVASLQGITRRIVAVVSPETFAQAREQARQAKNARVTASEVYSTHQGFPRWFTTLELMSPPGEPVLLYVAASAFRGATPAAVLDALRRRGVLSDAAVLCSMTGDEAVTDQERQGLAEFARLLQGGGA